MFDLAHASPTDASAAARHSTRVRVRGNAADTARRLGCEADATEFELPGAHLLAPTLRGELQRRGDETVLVLRLGASRAVSQFMMVWTVSLTLAALAAIAYLRAQGAAEFGPRAYVAVAGIWAALTLFLHGGRRLVERLEDRDSARHEFRRELWRTLGVAVTIPPGGRER